MKDRVKNYYITEKVNEERDRIYIDNLIKDEI